MADIIKAPPKNSFMGCYWLDLGEFIALPTFIPLPEAAKRLGIPETRLRMLVQAGRMKAIEINGEIAVSEESVENENLRQRLLEKKICQFIKNLLRWPKAQFGLARPREKYTISLTTISGWGKSGLIEKRCSEKSCLAQRSRDCILFRNLPSLCRPRKMAF